MQMFNFFKRKKHVIPYIETHLVDHCNLKCDKCGHYCHLINEEIFTDLKQFTKDMKELSKKVKIRRIRLLGGEPLLHPQINDFCKVTRKFFPSADIRVVTNGTLLQTMKEDFWITLKNQKIKIDISKYPIWGDKFDDLLNLINKKGIQIGNIIISNYFYDKLNEDGSEDKNESFATCASNDAINLWKQKLYTCQACYRYYYNKINNKNIPLPKGIDIYKASGSEIVAAFKEPDDACRYCNRISNKYKWQRYNEKGSSDN